METCAHVEGTAHGTIGHRQAAFGVLSDLASREADRQSHTTPQGVQAKGPSSQELLMVADRQGNASRQEAHRVDKRDLSGIDKDGSEPVAWSEHPDRQSGAETGMPEGSEAPDEEHPLAGNEESEAHGQQQLDQRGMPAVVDSFPDDITSSEVCQKGQQDQYARHHPGAQDPVESTDQGQACRSSNHAAQSGSDADRDQVVSGRCREGEPASHAGEKAC